MGTAEGERLMRPGFGCRVHEYLFFYNGYAQPSPYRKCRN
ncbi:hypothetical protein [Methanosarcina horonobensis]